MGAISREIGYFGAVPRFATSLALHRLSTVAAFPGRLAIAVKRDAGQPNGVTLWGVAICARHTEVENTEPHRPSRSRLYNE